MFKKALVALALCLAPASGAFAQTQAQSVIGYWSTSGCPGSTVPCFIQYGSTIPTSGGAATTDVNQKQVNGATINVGTGASSTGTQRVTTSTDSTIATITNPVTVTDGAGALNVIIDSGTTAVTSITNPVTVNPAAATTGGCTPYHLSGGTAASNNSTNIKSSAGTLCSLTAINTTATVYYLRMYNSAAAPTCSSATGAVHTYPIPASATGAGLTIPLGAFGEAYGTGIGFCVTGGGADTDNTSAATGVYIEASYK